MLNFAGLHALPIHLDHPVLAVDVLQVSVRQSPCQVAGVKKALSIDLAECPLRGLRKVQIAEENIACYANLAFLIGHSHVTQQDDLKPVHRRANGGILIGFVYLENRDGQGDFAHAVDVVQLVGVSLYHAHPFAAGEHIPQTIGTVFEVLQQLRADKNAADLMVSNIVRDPADILSLLIGQNVHRGAHGQRGQQVQHQGNKAERRRAGNHICGAHIGDILNPLQPRHEAVPALHHTLWSAGGPGGIGDQRTPLAGRLHNLLQGFLAHGLFHEAFINRERTAAILSDIAQALRRVGRIQRHRGSTHPEHPEQRCHIPPVTRQQDGDGVPFFHTRACQQPRNPGGHVVQLLIGGGSLPILIDNSGFDRIALGKGMKAYGWR